MYRTCSWREERRKLSYKPRRAEESLLHQLAYGYREELSERWEELFLEQYGPSREEMFLSLDEFLNCGVFEHGVARVYCGGCQYSYIVPFSCKMRHLCPPCSSKRAVLFAEHLDDEILEPVAHHHVVFSIPKRVRRFFLWDRSFFQILFAAAKTTLEFCHDGVGEQIGAVLTLQTASDDLGWNPHIHGILASGTFTRAGEFSPNSYESTTQELLTETFAKLVLRELEGRELLSEEEHHQILSQEHTGFSVWMGDPFTDEESNKFVARYIERSPVSLRRLSLDGDVVQYVTKDQRNLRFHPMEFLARVLIHVARPYESLTRYYGYYSPRSRGERKKKALQSGGHSPAFSDELPESSSPPSSSWQKGMKAFYEIDPLECPECGSQMKIISFIHDPAEIKKIMASLHIPPYRAPPKLAPFPEQLEFDALVDDIPDYDFFDEQ